MTADPENRHIIDRLRERARAPLSNDAPTRLAELEYVRRLLREAADRIEAMQNAGTAMARRLDELEPGPFGSPPFGEECPDVEVEELATGFIERAGYASDGYAVRLLVDPNTLTRRLEHGDRVLLVAIPDTIDVVPA